MNKSQLLKELRASKEFFDRSTRELEEADSTFSPSPGVMTTAQQVAHVASTVDWFLDGATTPHGFDLDFENHKKKYEAVTSLKTAREWLDKAFERACSWVENATESDLNVSMPQGEIMGGEPRTSALLGIIEHTAHHRGALTIYARLRGKIPPMPYMDM